MKKEYVGATIVALYILSYVLDYLAGPIDIAITNPFIFLQEQLPTYPFTAVAIGIKTIAIFLTLFFITSFIEKRFFLKAVIVFCIAALLELYAIQQLATGQRLVPIGWTLSFAFSGLTLILLTIIFTILGITTGIASQFKKDTKDPFAPPTQQGQ